METLDFGEPRQNGFDYPLPLVEKYQPHKIANFIGLEGPKRGCSEIFCKLPGRWRS